MDRGFGLRFLDGVGETYDRPVIKCPDYENRVAAHIEYGDGVVRSSEFIEDEDVRTSADGGNGNGDISCDCGRRKGLVTFLLGCLAGIGFMVLFGKDENKKNKKENE